MTLKGIFTAFIIFISLSVFTNSNAFMEVGSNHWDVNWGVGADPFINRNTNVTEANPWKPELLTEAAIYSVQRYSNWGRNSDDDGDDRVHWKDRTQKSDTHQRPVAYEWMIDFSNRTQSDMWITVPHRTFEDQQYWTELAKLILAKLDPKLKLYIEYSNEVWNGMFKQYHYAVQNGIDLGFSDNGEHLYKGSQWFYVYASVRFFEKFEQVWGNNNPRLVKVIAGKASNTFTMKQHLNAFKDPFVNPNRITFDVYAIAPYFGNKNKSIDELDAAVQKAIHTTAENAAILDGTGIDLIAYEGGQHLKQNADIINRDPRLYQLYMDYLNGIDDYLSLFVHYCHAGAYKTNNAWGSKEYIGAPIDSSHKYRALLDYIQQNSSGSNATSNQLKSRKNYKSSYTDAGLKTENDKVLNEDDIKTNLPSRRNLLDL